MERTWKNHAARRCTNVSKILPRRIANFLIFTTRKTSGLETSPRS